MKNPKAIIPSRAAAIRRTNEVKAQFRVMETGWAKLGRLIERALHDNVPAGMGMNAKQWMESTIGISASKGWTALRTVKALTGVPEKKMEQITGDNAKVLIRLPEKERRDPRMVQAAIDLPTKEFEEKIESKIAEKTGKPREEFITLRIHLPRAIYEELEKAVQKMARVCGIDLLGNEGRRIMVYERIAALVNGIQEETLKAATEGGQ